MAELPFHDRDGQIWVDGALVPWRDAKVHVLTHGLHYGSSVFEGERAYGGVIFKSEEHTERLLQSAKMLGFEIPYGLAEIESAKAQVMKVNQLTDAYLRPIAWRGSEQMGISAKQNTIHLAIAAWEWGAYFGEGKMKGIRLVMSEWRRPSPETIPSHAKAAGLYMICTIAKHAAEEKGFTDALMLDYRGQVAECTGANIFFIKGDEVHTPVADCFLDGITRRTAIQLVMRRNLRVVERAIWPEEIPSFEQCFVTGTAAEVSPVAQIETTAFKIGDTVRNIAKDYEDLVNGRIQL